MIATTLQLLTAHAWAGAFGIERLGVGCDLDTLQSALDLALPGDVVRAAPGNYEAPSDQGWMVDG